MPKPQEVAANPNATDSAVRAAILQALLDLTQVQAATLEQLRRNGAAQEANAGQLAEVTKELKRLPGNRRA